MYSLSVYCSDPGSNSINSLRASTLLVKQIQFWEPIICFCQSLKLFFSLLLSAGRSMQPSSNPFASDLNHNPSSQWIPSGNSSEVLLSVAGNTSHTAHSQGPDSCFLVESLFQFLCWVLGKHCSAFFRCGHKYTEAWLEVPDRGRLCDIYKHVNKRIKGNSNLLLHHDLQQLYFTSSPPPVSVWKVIYVNTDLDIWYVSTGNILQQNLTLNAHVVSRKIVVAVVSNNKTR